MGRTMRKLPADVARCPGYESESGDLREGCEDCLRRTDRTPHLRVVWIEPPPLVVFECGHNGKVWVCQQLRTA